jgi:hypothetical protein
VHGGDLVRAIALYQWNAEVASAFWAVLGHVEVVVRNAMHEQLAAWSVRRFGETRWYLDPGRVLTPRPGGTSLAPGTERPAGGDINRPLAQLHGTALTVAGWICPDTRDWIGTNSHVDAVLENRP